MAPIEFNRDALRSIIQEYKIQALSSGQFIENVQVSEVSLYDGSTHTCIAEISVRASGDHRGQTEISALQHGNHKGPRATISIDRLCSTGATSVRQRLFRNSMDTPNRRK